MSLTSTISLHDSVTEPQTKILQLYEHLELFSSEAPAHNTLFVLGHIPLSVLSVAPESSEQLLLIDPPLDVETRFRLEGNIAVLYTGDIPEVGLPRLQTEAGGTAHIQIGQHYLDIHSLHYGNVVHLPAVGVLCGGRFGSDLVPPQIAPESDGQIELEGLRLLAQLLKQHALQSYIPHIGSLCREPVEAMRRLANDVAYLHELRRVVPAAVQAEAELADLLLTGDSLLPDLWRSALGQEIHDANLATLFDYAHDINRDDLNTHLLK